MRPRILIVKIGAVGDVVCTMPMLGGLKSVFPAAHITWVVGNSCAELLRGHAALSRLVEVDDAGFFATSPLTRCKAVAQLLRSVERCYELILIGHRDPAYALALRPFVRGPLYRVVRSRGNTWWSKPVFIPPQTMHEGEAMRSLLRAGLAELDRRDDFPWAADFSHIPDSTHDLPAPFAIVHVGGGSNVKTDFELKQWPHTSDFIAKFTSSWAHPLALVGSPKDRSDADRFLGRLLGQLGSQQRNRIHDFVGRTSLLELVGLSRRARLFVGPDSGPLHIADALGTPAIGLYGPTSTVSWGLAAASSRMLSEAVECSPCYKDDGVFPACPYAQKCMVNLTPDRVLAASLQLLDATAHP